MINCHELGDLRQQKLVFSTGLEAKKSDVNKVPVGRGQFLLGDSREALHALSRLLAVAGSPRRSWLVVASL